MLQLGWALKTLYKLNILLLHLYEIFGIGKSIEIERRLLVSRGWEEGKLAVTVEKYGAFKEGNKNVMELVVMFAQHCEYTKTHWILHLKCVKIVTFKSYVLHLKWI